MSLRPETGLPAGFEPNLFEAASEPGRRLPERSGAAHAHSLRSQLRGRAVPAARRQRTAAPGDRVVRTGVLARADRAITRRRGRGPRAWGEACGPRTTQPRPLRSRKAGRRMTASASQPPDSQRSISMRIPGGGDAPARARRSVRSQLEGHIPPTTASDAALLVSELVTNSVVHAHVGPRRALTVDVTTLHDRLRIAVTDPGSRLRPCMLPRDPETPGGLGLALVDQLCETWGARQDLGSTCVWCELLLDQSPPSSRRAATPRPTRRSR